MDKEKKLVSVTFSFHRSLPTFTHFTTAVCLLQFGNRKNNVKMKYLYEQVLVLNNFSDFCCRQLSQMEK